MLVVFAAMLLASTVLASGLASTTQRTMQDNVAIRSLDSGGDEPLCAGTAGAGNCLGHCVQNIKRGEQDPTLVAAAVAVAAPVVLRRVRVPVGPRPLVVASAPPVVGPQLTILFHNLRN